MKLKRKGFSLLEMLLVLGITGLLLICLAPVLTKKKKIISFVDKIECVPGARIVIANANAIKENEETAPDRKGKIELPPGVNEFYLTLSGGGGGGQAAEINRLSVTAGAGGGGADFVYRKKVSYELKDGDHAVLHYVIGSGGAGAVDYLFEFGSAVADTKSGENSPKSSYAGNRSYIYVTEGETSNRLLLTIEEETGDTSKDGNAIRLIKNTVVEVGGGLAASAATMSGGTENIQGILTDEEVTIDYKVSAGGAGNGNGQNGESSAGFLPGLGGGSVFGVGSFGSGGIGGMDAMEKRFNIKRGMTGYRRCGEDGIGGIMIVEYDSVCETVKDN